MAKESPQKRKKVNHVVTKDTDVLSSNRNNETSSYNASILDDLLGFSPKENNTMTERVYLNCFEDNGEVSNSDEEGETTITNIESFLYSHKIRVSIKGPGQ